MNYNLNYFIPKILEQLKLTYWWLTDHKPNLFFTTIIENEQEKNALSIFLNIESFKATYEASVEPLPSTNY